MKRFYKTIMAAAVLLSFAPSVFAQGIPTDIIFPDKDEPYTINETTHIGYKKQISKPNSDGVYHILLDAFVTGREIKKQISLPADIVLVLDVSGSMNDSFGSTQTYNPSSTSSWNYGNTSNTFVKYGNEYYNVQRGRYDRGRFSNPRYYTFLFFTDSDNNQYYLWESSIIPATRPVSINMNNPEYYASGNNNNSEIYTGVLYTPGSPTKLSALKSAVLDFIDLIDNNDLEQATTPGGRLGNQIAIVTFAATASTQVGFTPLSEKETLISVVRGLTANGGTIASDGMQNAYDLLFGSSSHLKTAVLFTDGNPGYMGDWTSHTWSNNHGGYYYDDNTWDTANSTISIANDIKNLAVESDDPQVAVISNVFTVSIIIGPSNYTNVYLEKTSSNYLNATSMGSKATWNDDDPYGNGNGVINTQNTDDPSERTDFSLTASSADELKNAFATIAGNSGGAGKELGTESVTAVDVVSASFMLPEGADESSIRVYTAPCNGWTTAGQPTFGPDTLAKNRIFKYQPMKKNAQGILIPDGDPTDVDDGIDVSLDYPDGQTSGKKNKISVNGFDYSNNWCGPIENNGTITGYHGNKVSILVPIKMDPNALGGIGVNTNGTGSGIFIDGENQAPFESPKLNLPVNIIIKKEGLDVGESSKFTIQRRTSSSSDWEDVTSVFVTRHKGQDVKGANAPQIRVVGMPATDESGKEYIYNIREDGWSWSYTSDKGAISTAEQPDNPFVFTNTKKPNIDYSVRHAESKATNAFTEGGGAKFDDSKKNTKSGRVIIEVEPSTESGSTTNP